MTVMQAPTEFFIQGLVMSSQECELFNLKGRKRDISNPSAFEMSRLLLR